MGIASGLIDNGQQSAAEIIEEMVAEAVEGLSSASGVLVRSDCEKCHCGSCTREARPIVRAG